MLALVSAVVGMLGAVAGHLVACRLGLRLLRAYGASLIAGFLLCFACLAAAEGGIGSLLLALELYLAWWFVFLNLVQASESSLRVRILREVREAGGAIAREALLARYNDEALSGLRLERLIGGGGVTRRDGRLYVASAVLRGLARLFLGLKLLVLGRRSEFG